MGYRSKEYTVYRGFNLCFLCGSIQDEQLYDERWKIYRILSSSQISGRMYNTLVSIKCMKWKVCHSPTLCRYWDTIIYFQWQKQDSLRGLTDLFENLSENSLKGVLSNDNIVSPPLFSFVNTFRSAELFDAEFESVDKVAKRFTRRKLEGWQFRAFWYSYRKILGVILALLPTSKPNAHKTAQKQKILFF